MSEKQSKNKKVDPELAGGFQDYLPNDAEIRKSMKTIIRNEFERFGFLPLETPGVEKYDVLTGGDDNISKQIYRLARPDTKEENIGLRFDLTVPLARVVASYSSEIKFPFKRYQIGNVWRGERQQAGRFKEFTQCDVDIVGTKRMESDSEIIQLAYSALKKLGIEDIKIKINNRKILNGLSEYADYDSEKNDDVIRVLDKLDKIGWDGVEKELLEGSINLSKENAVKIKDFIETKNKNKDKLIDEMDKKVGDIDISKEGLEELREISRNLNSLEVPDNIWELDFSLARGLSYYTGPVFEIKIAGKESFGSISAGGRYDNLVDRFSPTSIPAVGISIGFDRLFEIIKDDAKKEFSDNLDVLVLNFDEDCVEDVQKLSNKLRNEGIKTSLYVGQDNSMKGQISYGVSMGAKFICILGKDEKDKGIVQIKNIETREQEGVELNSVADFIKTKI